MPHQRLHTSGQLSTLSQRCEYRVTQNTEALKNRTLTQLGNPQRVLPQKSIRALWYFATYTCLKRLSKFLIYGNILLNVSAALIPIRGTPTSLEGCGALGWVFVVSVFSLHTGRNKDQYPIWSNTVLVSFQKENSKTAADSALHCKNSWAFTSAVWNTTHPKTSHTTSQPILGHCNFKPGPADPQALPSHHR